MAEQKNAGKTFEYNNGQGGLFVQEGPKKQEKSPDFTGQVRLPNGELRWLSGWKKPRAGKDDWISLQVGEIVQPKG